MESTKEWYKSKTIWASLVVLVTGLLATFGVGDFGSEQDAIVDTIMQIVTAVCGIVALVGRITAKSKLTGPKNTGTYSILLCLILLLFAGCGDVQMSPDYAQQLETSAINVAELNKRCQGGDDEACKRGLDKASETLDLLVDGLHGRGGDE